MVLVFLSIAAFPAWADDDDEHHQPSRDIHVAVPGLVQVDVTHGAPPQPIAVEPSAGYVVETRGPVHEAFAEPIELDPSAGLVVSRRPPDPLEEAPPDAYPQGDDVNWVSGYWGWDDDRTDFVWVSGIWRNMPPDRQWVPGYWMQVQTGYQWVSGFWQDERSDVVTYLPQPPETLETGPVGEPSRPDAVWLPGTWLWRGTGYAWRPGYWVQAHESWLWTPDHYVWAPAGYVFINGYWDYAVPRRGVLFAPIYMPPNVIVQRPGFIYSPTVVVNVSMLFGDLFARPRYCHYYFGDYYDRQYFRAGIYPAVSFYDSDYGYDPLFAHYLARQPGGRRVVLDRMRGDYRFRREHPEYRLPRTYAGLREMASRRDLDPRISGRLGFARSLREVADQPGQSSFRFERLGADRINAYRQTGRQTRDYQDRRRQLESEPIAARAGGPSIPSDRAVAGRERPVTPRAPADRSDDRDVSRERTQRSSPQAEPKPGERSSPPPTTPSVRKPAAGDAAEPGRTPIDVQRKQAEPRQLRLQRSPLVGRRSAQEDGESSRTDGAKPSESAAKPGRDQPTPPRANATEKPAREPGRTPTVTREQARPPSDRAESRRAAPPPRPAAPEAQKEAAKRKIERRAPKED